MHSLDLVHSDVHSVTEK